MNVFVSPISAYELALKATLGKLASLPKPFAELANLSDFSILPITMEQCELAGRLPFTCRNPWDRLISAQSILAPMPLLSRDTKILELGAEVIW